MAQVDQTKLYDMSESFMGGVDSGKQPRLLDANHVVRSINCSYRGGYLSSRQGIRNFPLNFDTPATKSAFLNGYFQGAGFYSNFIYNQPSILVASSGKIFRIQLFPQFANVTLLSPATNSAKVKQAFFCEADIYMIIQDGQSKPLIYDGSRIYRATANQVPVGTVMAYGQGRLFVAVSPFAVRAGDIYGPIIGSVLNFTETNFLAEGGDFGPPPWLGPITGLFFQPTQDTSTGQGPLLMMGATGCMSFNVQNIRTSWQTSPFAVEALVNSGALGSLLATAVNGDLWYRAFDGWRSFRSARAEISKWAHQSTSNEVTHRLQDESSCLLNFGSAVTFDNRLIATLMPQQGKNGIYHLGMVVLDFFPISTIQQLNEIRYFIPLNPAWTDMWTGVQPYQLMVGKMYGEHRCFILANHSNQLALYEISNNDPFDNFGSENQRIVSSVELRASNFKKDDEEKKLVGADLWFNNLAGEIDIKVQYRPDEYPLWYDWYEASMNAQYVSTDESNVLQLDIFQRPFFPRFSIPAPPIVDDPNTNRTSDRGYTFQMRLEITGCWSISRIRLVAQKTVEKTKFQEGGNP